MKRKTIVDFDKYVKGVIKRDPSVKKELEKADQAWEIAFQIRVLRLKRGLTQIDLAREAKVSQPNIARIESAEYRGYTLNTLQKVSKALKAQVDVTIVPDEKVSEYKKDFPRPIFAI